MNQSFEEWLDKDDPFDPVHDQNPERAFASPDLMAQILGLSTRHLRRLVKAGVVAPRTDGQFDRMATLSRFLAHKEAQPLPMRAGLRSRQEQILAGRLERDAAKSIGW